MEYIPFFRFTSVSTEAGIALGAVMLVGGLICLLYGWKIYRFLVVVTCGLMAGYVGWYFLNGRLSPVVAVVVPIVIGLVGALVAISIQKAVVCLLAGAVGFVSLGPVAAELLWRPPDGPTPTHYLASGAVAFFVMGVLAILLFRPIIVTATSMFGSTLLVSAAVHIVEAFAHSRRGIYARYPNELAWIYAGLTITGIVFQMAVLRKRKISD